MFKKVLKILIITLVIFILSACGKRTNNKEATAVAYGITHKDYVGKVVLSIKGDSVTEVTFDEAFLPNTWAKLKTQEGSVPDDVISDTDGAWYGKYLVIGDKHFTGSLREEVLELNGVSLTKQVIKFSTSDISDLYVWLAEKEENRKWYYDTVANGEAYVSKADFSTKANYETSGLLTKDGNLAFTKQNSNYWEGENYKLGWKGNMEQIKKAFIGTKMNATIDNITKGADNYWVVNGVVTGATLVDFKDYYMLAQTAYNKALAQ